MAWRDNWRPASFRGAGFHVDVGHKVSGQRGIEFEFPKRDEPYFEPLGRRARRWAISGYVIGPDYTRDADALERALIGGEAGTLQHPTMGSMQVFCETYTRTERRTEGGFASFDMTFAEAGKSIASRITENTQADVQAKAGSAEDAVKNSNDKQLSEAPPPI